MQNVQSTVAMFVVRPRVPRVTLVELVELGKLVVLRLPLLDAVVLPGLRECLSWSSSAPRGALERHLLPMILSRIS